MKIPLLCIVALMIMVLSVIMIFLHYKENSNHLVLYGNVDIRQVDLGFRVSGRLKEMLVEEGDQVKRGDLLAVLDKVPYEADFASAKAGLAQAEANYLKLQHGSRPQEIEEARALVREKQAAVTNAELIFARQKEQIKIGASSQQNYDDAFAQKNEAEAQLKSAQENLSLAEEGFRIEDIQAGKAAMEVAKAQLESAKINLTDTEIFSPSDGIILTRVREPGAIIAPQSIIYTLTLHKPVWIRAYVSETDLGRIKPGMIALIYTDADPDNPFKAQIGFISPTAEFTPKAVETPELRTDLVYRLRLYVDDPKGKLRQGMPVTVKLDVKK
ncbi:MAG: secretion protein HlyD [Alphaproteobacteria bacterium]|nr:secretion protein HlyD [Alphaproteobacteria bacterium]